MEGFYFPEALTDGRRQKPSALTSSVICPPNVTHVPAEKDRRGSDTTSHHVWSEYVFTDTTHSTQVVLAFGVAKLNINYSSFIQVCAM